MTRIQSAKARWRDDRGLGEGIAVAILLLLVLGGAGLIFDGGRALSARRQAINEAEGAARAGAATVAADGLTKEVAEQAARDFLAASGVTSGDIVQVYADNTTVTVIVKASRDAVFAELLGNDTIVVRGSGKASASFGSTP
jgi:Flp pilus assembly protein TadG